MVDKGVGSRIVYFDILNIISCIAVIGLHMNAGSWAYENTVAWRQALGVEVLFYFAVPVFFMLTGATLMNYRSKYTTKEFLKKRAIKILIPYLVWSTAFYIMSLTQNRTGSIQYFIEAFTAYQAQPIFWFLQAVFNVYLCLPLLSMIADRKYVKLRWYLIGLGIVTRMLLPMCTQFTGISFGNYSGLFCMDGVLIYALLGYQLAQSELPRAVKAGVGVAGIAAMAIRYLGTVILSVDQGTLATDFYGYVTIWAMLPAVALFLLVKEIPLQKINDAARSRLSMLSSFSFGVYLMHLIVIAVFSKVAHLSNTSLLYRLGGPLVIYAVCCLVVFVLKKIPILRRIVP